MKHHSLWQAVELQCKGEVVPKSVSIVVENTTLPSSSSGERRGVLGFNSNSFGRMLRLAMGPSGNAGSQAALPSSLKSLNFR